MHLSAITVVHDSVRFKMPFAPDELKMASEKLPVHVSQKLLLASGVKPSLPTPVFASFSRPNLVQNQTSVCSLVSIIVGEQPKPMPKITFY